DRGAGGLDGAWPLRPPIRPADPRHRIAGPAQPEPGKPGLNRAGWPGRARAAMAPRPIPAGVDMFRKLYDWTLHLAAHRHALRSLALISFAESSFFPIPPDVIVIPMV